MTHMTYITAYQKRNYFKCHVLISVNQPHCGTLTYRHQCQSTTLWNTDLSTIFQKIFYLIR